MTPADQEHEDQGHDESPGLVPPEEKRRANVPPLLEWLAAVSWRVVVIALGLALAAIVFWTLRLVFLPVIVAAVLATVLGPLVEALKRQGARPALATAVVMMVAIALPVVFIVLIAPTVAAEFDDLGERLVEGVEEVQAWMRNGPLNLSAEQLDNLIEQGRQRLMDSQETIIARAVTGAVAAIEFLAGLLLAIAITFFILKDSARITRWLAELVPANRREDARAVGSRGWRTLGGYIKGVSINGLVEGVITGIALVIIGVPLALPIAILTFFAAFIPLAGPILAGAVATLVALVSNGFTDALIVLVLYIAIQQLEGNVLEPVVMARAVHVHALVILLSIAAGAILAGIIGALISVPLVTVGAAMLDEIRARRMLPTVTDKPSRPPPDPERALRQ